MAAEPGPGDPGRAGGQDEDELSIFQPEQKRSDEVLRGRPALAGCLRERPRLGGVHVKAVGKPSASRTCVTGVEGIARILVPRGSARSHSDKGRLVA
jgi:hypothetical protein